jgi:2-hydroxy-3-oxopropionate reductase
MKTTVGFIGLGIMGKPMAKNLLKAGYGLVVHDLNRAAVSELAAAGAAAASSPREVAQQARVLITMLPNSPEVEEVLTGPGGVFEGIAAGSTIIDMSSISPVVARKMGDLCAKKSIKFLDAPVSGGEPGAINGTLSIMVGGPGAVFEEWKDLLLAMGKSAVRVGEVGSGNVTKLANQIMVALHLAAMSEAFVLGAKAGVDPAAIFQAIRGGLAGSNVLEAKALRVLEGNFEPGFKIDLHLKDLGNALDAGRQMGVPLPLTAQVMEILKSLKVYGLGQKDHSAILRFYEKLAGIKTSSGAVPPPKS